MTGGVILAAGLSSRMGEFKPMLKIGDTTFIRKLILQMREVGVEKIVVVTGYRHEELQEHIMNDDVVWIHNNKFYCTQMLDSVKLAVSYLKDQCDRILLSPVDVVMTPQWIFDAVIQEDTDFVRPMYKGKCGHPVLIKHTLFDDILSYEGDGGLRGAVEASGKNIVEIDTEEAGVLFDADTKEDYHKALYEYDVRMGLLH